MNAEMAARRTAAAAVLADFRREVDEAPLSRPPGREWLLRLSTALGDVLDQADVEPEPGKLAAIRGVLGHYDTGTVGARESLERIEQIAGASRTASGAEPDGGAYVTPADLQPLGQALADAIEYRTPGADCPDCDDHPAGLCFDHAGDLDRTDAYLELARQLGIEVDR